MSSNDFTVSPADLDKARRNCMHWIFSWADPDSKTCMAKERMRGYFSDNWEASDSDLRQMFGFALDRELIDADPTSRIKKAKIGPDGERDRDIG